MKTKVSLWLVVEAVAVGCCFVSGQYHNYLALVGWACVLVLAASCRR